VLSELVIHSFCRFSATGQQAEWRGGGGGVPGSGKSGPASLDQRMNSWEEAMGERRAKALTHLDHSTG
jgi:hypothetical protein